MVSKVYMICNAYESGIGHGLKQDGVCNPYFAGSDEREAWQTGYDEGKDRAKDDQPQPGRVEGMRLGDSQWVNIVNHADCYRDMDKEAAVAAAVKLTEQAMAKNVRDGFPATRPTASSKEQDHG
jgi:hypothetical protein